MKDPSINFLPWREGRRQRRWRLFCLLAVAAAGSACALVMAVASWNLRAVALQEQRNAYLQMRLAQLAPQAQQLQALRRRQEQAAKDAQALRTLEAGRWQAAGLLHILAQQVPEDVVLHSLSVGAGRCVLRGVAMRPEVLPQMVRALQTSSWFQEPRLQEMGVEEEEEQEAGGARRYFLLHADIPRMPPVAGPSES